MNIGDNIRKYRKEKNMSMKDLSSALNVSVQAIGNYERGDREPNFEMLEKISEILDVPLYVLLTFNDEELAAIKSEFKNKTISPEIVKTVSSEHLKEFFESYLKHLIQSTYGYKINLTDEQINNLMKISNNSLLPALELLNSKK